ncbi:CRISPR-associated ring nuclease Csm6 [Accumulibacter sp.]|jgi:CRISPR-associated protein (TIGR02584 family)|uniref:CRISPR-associated protein, NE0113 family n=1 Tax=Accumulibacter regalis TaxID=522306 RepID=C7RP15_ACCRE|nr:CRISPR-associated ring nuclease Csm6 [Accumulibacter sp.]MBN8496519.1 TIGR02584 family CRISPR-associated protein [Accumulibacter sp.]MBO3715435.1 TIGR02584 family CRISPR-associated protein [Accumulibacter sp.]
MLDAHQQPHQFPRRLLVAVTGLSPQIVTETLYALAVAPPASAFVPTEIHLITTRSGAEKARLALLSDEPGWFHRLSNDYALPPIHFANETIHVLEDADGRPLEDIRSPEDNRRAADGITGIIRGFTADPDCALHVSIAGGRKTMGFFLGYALSLYGRPQDKLSHVLVSEPFEASLGFYYPTPTSRVLEMPGGRLVDSAKAQVTLAELPFVSLRHGLPEALLTGLASYNETVEAARHALAPAELQIDLATRRVRAAGKIFALPPAELALLSVFARRALRGEAPLPAPAKELADADWKKRYLVELRWIAGPMKDLDETERALRKGMDGGYFSAHLSKLKKILRRELGPVAEPYLISDGGSRPRRYSLGLRPTAVTYDALEQEGVRGCEICAPLQPTPRRLEN